MGIFDSIGGFLGFGQGRNRVDQDAGNLPGFGSRGSSLIGEAGRRGNRSVGQVGAAQIGQFGRAADDANQAAIRNRQVGFLDQLSGLASGTGPSLAQQQLRQGTDRGIRQQLALAAGAPGGQAASAGRDAARNIGNLSAGLSGQAAELRSKEQLGALGQLGNALQGVRGQDIGLSQFDTGQANQRLLQQAGLDQRGAEFDINSMLKGRQLDDNILQQLLALELQNAQSQQKGQLDIQSLLSKLPTAGEQFQGALGAGVLSLSDKDSKTGIKSASAEFDSVLDSLQPKSFVRRDARDSAPFNPGEPRSGGAGAAVGAPADGMDEELSSGREVGLVAQDLESSPAGSAIVPTERGKAINTSTLVPFLGGAIGRLNERLKLLEGKKG